MIFTLIQKQLTLFKNLPAFFTAEIPEFSAWLVKLTVCETAATGAPAMSSAIRSAAGTGT